MHKKIGFYLGPSEFLDEVFEKMRYFPSYQWLSERCEAADLSLIFLRGKRTSAAMQFEYHYIIKNERPVAITPEPVDVIFDKDRRLVPELRNGDRVVNLPNFNAFCTNKWEQYKLFGKYMAPTLQVTQPALAYLDSFTTSKIVFKPIDGTGGEGIHIVERKPEVLQSLALPEDYLVQPFIDTSEGVPGLVKGYHDLRIIVLDGEIITAYIRHPAKGSLLANISQGGTAFDLTIDQIPSILTPLVREIDNALTQYGPRLYSIDFLFAGEKPYLCELNSKPGFPLVEQTQDYTDRFLDANIRLFQEGLTAPKLVL